MERKMKKILIGLISLLFGLSLVSAQTYNCPGFGMMSGFNGSYGWGMMTFSWLFSLLVIALFIAAIYWLVKNANRKDKGR